MTPLVSTASASAILSPIIKDIYELGKTKISTSFDMWSNRKTISTLAKKIASYEKVKTIIDRYKESKLSEFYYPPKVVFPFPPEGSRTVQSLRDIPKDSSYVIEGIVGQGKSILLRYLCIQELSDKSSGRIPVFVELRRIEQGSSLKAAVLSSMTTLGLIMNDEYFDIYAESGKIILLLDGFDELDETSIKPVLNQLDLWSELYSDMQIIVTSRPDAEIQKSCHFRVIKIAPLTESDYKPFFSKINMKPATSAKMIEEIKNSSTQISGILTTPLLLTLLKLVYDRIQSIPNELPDFFQALFTTVFSGHDQTKGAFKRKSNSGLNERKLELLFEAFCFMVLKQGYTTSLTRDNFGTAFKEASRFVEDKCEEDDFKHDIIKVSCLMQEEGLHIDFLHKSLLDYFSAAFIKHCTSPQAESFYKEVPTDTLFYSWRQVITFLSQIDKYRYEKYFAIPKAITAFNYLNLTPNSIDPERIQAIIPKLFNNSIISFRITPKEENKLTPQSISWGGQFPLYVQSIFSESCTTIFAIARTKKDEHIRELASFKPAKTKRNDQDNVFVSVVDMLDNNDLSNLTATLHASCSKLEDSYNKSRSYVEREDAKGPELFSGLAKS